MEVLLNAVYYTFLCVLLIVILNSLIGDLYFFLYFNLELFDVGILV